MNKKDLTNKIAEKLNTTKKEANLIATVTVESIYEGLMEDSKVSLVGFGSFKLVERKARKARNPKTGETIDVPAKMAVKFTPSKAMKEDAAAQPLASAEAAAEPAGE